MIKDDLIEIWRSAGATQDEINRVLLFYSLADKFREYCPCLDILRRVLDGLTDAETKTLLENLK